MTHENEQKLAVLIVVLFIAALASRKKWRPGGTAHGTAQWMSEAFMSKAGMFVEGGLLLGRAFAGKLIWLRDYCHVLLIGATGAGKGVSIVIPNLFFYAYSIICFDPKGDLFATTAEWRRRRGQKVYRLAPFNGGKDGLNALDLIPADSPKLVDLAMAMAESLVVRTGMEKEPFWNDRSVQVITAILILVLLRMRSKERNLNTVQEIASDTDLLLKTAEKLKEIGGLPGRYGNHIKGLFEERVTEKESTWSLSREGAGVISNTVRHLSFLDSDLVIKSIEQSTFDVRELKHGATLYIQIPPDQLEAKRGLLRCWFSALINALGTGSERDGEVLFLIDEASALGSLPALKETLVRGRSAGVRLLLAYQSVSQVTATFKEEPSLLYDNCGTQIYLGASGYETAERISKSLGEWTQVVDSYGENQSVSHGYSGGSETFSKSYGSSVNHSQSGRLLLRPEEVLTLDQDLLIAFQRGCNPILAKRVKWYKDQEFQLTRKRNQNWLWLCVIGLLVLLLLWQAAQPLIGGD